MFNQNTDPLNKINKILLYSRNYSMHKKNLRNTKCCVDDSSRQRNSYNKKLQNQHNRYTEAVDNLKVTQLTQLIDRYTNRISQISNKKITSKKIKSQQQQSITSKSFWNLKDAKDRQRSKHRKSIEIQNKKIEERLINSRFKQNFGRQSYYKQKYQTEKDLDIMSRYSKRSQSILQSLVCKDLKIKTEDLPFLPQLSARSRQLNPQLRKSKILIQLTKLDKSKSLKKTKNNPTRDIIFK